MTYHDVCFWEGNYYTREVRPHSTTVYMDTVISSHYDPVEAQSEADRLQTEFENNPANWE